MKLSKIANCCWAVLPCGRTQLLFSSHCCFCGGKELQSKWHLSRPPCRATDLKLTVSDKQCVVFHSNKPHLQCFLGSTVQYSTPVFKMLWVTEYWQTWSLYRDYDSITFPKYCARYACFIIHKMSELNDYVTDWWCNISHMRWRAETKTDHWMLEMQVLFWV